MGTKACMALLLAGAITVCRAGPAHEVRSPSLGISCTTDQDCILSNGRWEPPYQLCLETDMQGWWPGWGGGSNKPGGVPQQGSNTNQDDGPLLGSKINQESGALPASNTKPGVGSLRGIINDSRNPSDTARRGSGSSDDNKGLGLLQQRPRHGVGSSHTQPVLESGRKGFQQLDRRRLRPSVNLTELDRGRRGGLGRRIAGRGWGDGLGRGGNVLLREDHKSCQCPPNIPCVHRSLSPDFMYYVYYCGLCGDVGSSCSSDQFCPDTAICSGGYCDCFSEKTYQVHGICLTYNVLSSASPVNLVLTLVLLLLLLLIKAISSTRLRRRVRLLYLSLRRRGNDGGTRGDDGTFRNAQSDNKTSSYTIAHNDFITNTDDQDLEWALELSRQLEETSRGQVSTSPDGDATSTTTTTSSSRRASRTHSTRSSRRDSRSHSTRSSIISRREVLADDAEQREPRVERDRRVMSESGGPAGLAARDTDWRTDATASASSRTSAGGAAADGSWRSQSGVDSIRTIGASNNKSSFSASTVAPTSTSSTEVDRHRRSSPSSSAAAALAHDTDESASNCADSGRLSSLSSSRSNSNRAAAIELCSYAEPTFGDTRPHREHKHHSIQRGGQGGRGTEGVRINGGFSLEEEEEEEVERGSKRGKASAAEGGSEEGGGGGSDVVCLAGGRRSSNKKVILVPKMRYS